MGDVKETMDEKWVDFINITYKTADNLDGIQFENTFLSGFKLFETRLMANQELPVVQKKLVSRASNKKYSILAQHVKRHSSNVQHFVKPNEDENLEILIQ